MERVLTASLACGAWSWLWSSLSWLLEKQHVGEEGRKKEVERQNSPRSLLLFVRWNLGVLDKVQTASISHRVSGAFWFFFFF